VGQPVTCTVCMPRGRNADGAVESRAVHEEGAAARGKPNCQPVDVAAAARRSHWPGTGHAGEPHHVLKLIPPPSARCARSLVGGGRTLSARVGRRDTVFPAGGLPSTALTGGEYASLPCWPWCRDPHLRTFSGQVQTPHSTPAATTSRRPHDDRSRRQLG
jgi:hypothetical protein